MKVIKLNGEIINIGAWDYMHTPVKNTNTYSEEEKDEILKSGRNPDFIYDDNGEIITVITNPLPAGAIEEDVELIKNSHGEYCEIDDYKKLRIYPSIEDQLDYIFHNGVDAWKKDMIQPVKDKHPKK